MASWSKYFLICSSGFLHIKFVPRIIFNLCCRHDAGSNRGLDVRAGGRGPVGGGGGPVGGGRGPVGGGRGGGDVGRSGDNRYLSSQLQVSYKFLVLGFIILLFRYRAYGL